MSPIPNFLAVISIISLAIFIRQPIEAWGGGEVGEAWQEGTRTCHLSSQAQMVAPTAPVRDTPNLFDLANSEGCLQKVDVVENEDIIIMRRP